MNINVKFWPAVEPIKLPFLKLVSATWVLALLAVGLCFTAPRARADGTIISGPVSAKDQEFMMAAAQGGMTEVRLGELAAQQATRQDLKEFGQMMAKDHTSIGDDLKALAVKKSVTLPDGLDEKHQKMVDKMAGLTGDEFDRAYVAAMLKAHKKDLKAFQAEGKSTEDADVKSFVEKAVPIISAHLQHITDLKNMK